MTIGFVTLSSAHMPQRSLHVALVPVGSHGDVHPFIGLGLRLKQRGHECTVITNNHFETLARDAGLGFLATSEDHEFREALKNRDLWHPRKAFHAVAATVAQILRPTYDRIAELHAEHGDRLVVAVSTLGISGKLAEEKLGIRLATLHLAPAVFQSVHDFPRFPGVPVRNTSPLWMKRAFYWLMNHIVDSALAKPVNAFRRDLGLPPVKKIFRWWNSSRLVLAMYPQWYAAVQADYPPKSVNAGFPLYDERGLKPLSPELMAFLQSGSKPIAFTPGSAMTHGREFFQASADACQKLGRRGILLTRHREQIPPNLPAGVIHADYAPFSELLPHCAAMVHHGGIGTASQGLAAGCPQLIHPFAHDQFDNAERLQKLGVGRSILPSKYNASRAAPLLHELISSPAIQEACEQTRNLMREVDGLGVACERIESLANG